MLVLIPVFAFFSQWVYFSCYYLDMRTMPKTISLQQLST